MGIVAYLQMQVGGSALHGDAQQVINIHSTLPPNNLPYDEPKSHWAQDDLSNGASCGRTRLLDWESKWPNVGELAGMASRHSVVILGGVIPGGAEIETCPRQPAPAPHLPGARPGPRGLTRPERA